jgi:hypothetical protein
VEGNGVSVVSVPLSDIVTFSVNGADYHAPNMAALDAIESAIRRGVRRVGPGTYIVW